MEKVIDRQTRTKDFHYYPEFFSSMQDTDGSGYYERLLEEIDFEQHTLNLFGREVKENHLGSSHSFDERVYHYSGSERKTKPMTETLLEIYEQIKDLVPVELNFVHCNLYRDGNDSIGYHSDSEKDMDRANGGPYIVSVSFGATRTFRFRKVNEKKSFDYEIKLGDGDVVVMKGECQKKYKHSVPQEKRIKEGRINLTFRRIKK